MRMWGINPKLMCRQHLLGEHKEIHMIIGCIRKGKKLNGYIKRNQIDVSLIISRHYKLVEEMKRRGYNHQSPITLSDAHLIAVYLRHNPSGKINPVKNQIELANRCNNCYPNLPKRLITKETLYSIPYKLLKNTLHKAYMYGAYEHMGTRQSDVNRIIDELITQISKSNKSQKRSGE